MQKSSYVNVTMHTPCLLDMVHGRLSASVWMVYLVHDLYRPTAANSYGD